MTTPYHNALHHMRTIAGISAEHLAYRLGVTTKTIYNWEHSLTVKPHQVYAYRGAIADVRDDMAPRYYQPELTLAAPERAAANGANCAA